MRVLCWTHAFWPSIGGVEKVASQLIGSLRPAGHEFAVMTDRLGQDWPETDEHDGVAIHRLDFHAAIAGRDVRAMASIRRRVSEVTRRFKPELHHVHDAFGGAMFYLSPAGRLPPLLLTLHCFLGDARSDRRTLLDRLVGGARRVTACSAAVLAEARAAFPDIRERSSVIYFGIDPPEIAPTPLPFDPPHLLCMGRLRTGKGFDLAIAALPAIRRACPGTTLTISGDGPERGRLEALAADLGLTDAVTLAGWSDPLSRDHRAVWQTINRATLVIVPSRAEAHWKEGFGLVAMESAALARPVVASCSGGLPEAVIDGQTGRLFETDRADALAAAVTELLTDPDAARVIGQAARRRALADFRWDGATAAQYNSLFSDLAKESSNAEGC